MKKIILITSALVLLTGYSANAAVDLSVGIGVPAPGYGYAQPAYVEPGYVVAPGWPSEHYDIHRHRHNDYWAARRHDDHARGHDDHGHK